MNKTAFAKEMEVVEIARSCIAARIHNAKAIAEFNGRHPIEIKSALLNVGAEALFNDMLADSLTSPSILHEIRREDNPVLSFWPFTQTTTVEISELAKGARKVALLGTPSLFSTLKSYRYNAPDDIILFDQDSYLFSESTSGFFKCDVSNIPNKFENNFDLVIADPPWYLDHYENWLGTAKRIARPDGKIAFVLFPEGIRESAKRERETILAFARSFCSNLKTSAIKVFYETPSFEQVQLIRNGIAPLDWRFAELIIGEILPDKSRDSKLVRLDQGKWQERRVGSGRLFVNISEAYRTGPEWLCTANPGDRFLSSPSRRNKDLANANILSSRGHGLTCADPAAFIHLIDKIDALSDVNEMSQSIGGHAGSLFKATIEDLWGRYIAL